MHLCIVVMLSLLESKIMSLSPAWIQIGMIFTQGTADIFDNKYNTATHTMFF